MDGMLQVCYWWRINNMWVAVFDTKLRARTRNGVYIAKPRGEVYFNMNNLCYYRKVSDKGVSFRWQKIKVPS